MAGKYKAYLEYKQSGVEWLGEIPSGWQVKRIKNSAELNPSKSELKHLSHDTEATFLPMESIGETGVVNCSRSKPIGEVFNGYTYLGEGDVCLAKITPCFENGKAAVVAGLKNGIAFATTEVIPIRCGTLSDAQFVYYLITSSPFKDEAEGSMYGAGGQKRVADSYVANYHFAAPPLPEQQQIAKFLDFETARIDRLIERQERLIGLLEEKRQAVISHAVTKGLNPDAPLRPSGIDWLGDVPEHWEVCRIKQFAKMESGHTPDKKQPEYWTDCNINWVSLNDTSQLKAVDYISETALKLNPKGIANSSARLLPSQAVVFTRDASIGLAAITTKEMAVSQHVIAWICDSCKVVPEYLLFVFYAMQEELERYTFGATLKTIGMPDINKLTSTLPPLNEQREIVEFVFSEKARHSEAIKKTRAAITLLKERRTALISAAVTGKIDVREWVPPKDGFQPAEESASLTRASA